MTSQIAIQTADDYEVAYQYVKQHSILSKQKRLPKLWTIVMKCKFYLFTAIAHFHAPNAFHEDAVVGERISRLTVAKTIGEKAEEKAKLVGGEIASFVLQQTDNISRSLAETDQANYITYHQSICKISNIFKTPIN